MDSCPDLDELVKKVDHHNCKLLREINLQGRSTKWPGVHVDGRQRAAMNQWCMLMERNYWSRSQEIIQIYKTFQSVDFHQLYTKHR